MRRTTATFELVGPIDGSIGGTFKVERATGLVHVRPKRRRRVYTLPIETVARIVVERIVKGELRERLAKKRAKKKIGLDRRRG